MPPTSRPTEYRKNHYVPVWYQRRFLEGGTKLHYLDLAPGFVEKGTRKIARKALRYLGPKKCFYEDDLYTTRFGAMESTEIEQRFFGEIDTKGREATEYFASFSHPSVDGDAFRDLLIYMSVQKLRTIKGLAYLQALAGSPDKNSNLIELQRLQQLFCAVWTECVWCILDARTATTGFIVTDHPVTIYNRECFPNSRYCRGFWDPDPRLHASHTIFALDSRTLLVLTNVSWVRNPYSGARKMRPNPALFRDAVFNFTDIQTGRELHEGEVLQINHALKLRARKYIAAPVRSWLYPEASVGKRRWDDLGDGYLFLPDPRSVSYTSVVFAGWDDGRVMGMDEYGRSPDHPGYRSRGVDDDFVTLHAFKGEYARVFGPKRRGQSFDFSRLSPEIDDDSMHKLHLGFEQRYKSELPWRASVRRARRGKRGTKR